MPRRDRTSLSPATLARVAASRRRAGAAEVDQAVALGLLEARAAGTSPDAAVLRAVQAVAYPNGRSVHAFGFPDDAYGERVDVAADRRTPRARRLRSRLTPGQRLRFSRDALIVLAVRHGFSRRRLAAILGMSKSRVDAVAATFQITPEPESDPCP